MKIILASKSPRRKRILEEAGYEITVDPSHADESQIEANNVTELVMEIAQLKAETVAKRYDNEIIVAADSLAYADGKSIGQQDTPKKAEAVLKQLRGKTHEVISGVCIINARNGKMLTNHDISKVTLKNVSDEVINKYIASGKYKGKAAAYNIKDPEFGNFIANYDGSWTNVMGLPIEKVQRMIQKLI